MKNLLFNKYGRKVFSIWNEIYLAVMAIPRDLNS